MFHSLRLYFLLITVQWHPHIAGDRWHFSSLSFSKYYTLKGGNLQGLSLRESTFSPDSLSILVKILGAVRDIFHSPGARSKKNQGLGNKLQGQGKEVVGSKREHTPLTSHIRVTWRTFLLGFTRIVIKPTHCAFRALLTSSIIPVGPGPSS